MKPGRKRMGTEKRIIKAYSIDPKTDKRIEDEAERTQTSQGQVVDRLAAKLRKKSKP